MLNKECYRISIVLAFSCERVKTTRIRYVWMRIFSFQKRRKKKSPFSKISGYLWTGPYFLETLPRGIQEKKTNKQAHKQERSPSYGSKAKLLRLILILYSKISRLDSYTLRIRDTMRYTILHKLPWSLLFVSMLTAF